MNDPELRLAIASCRAAYGGGEVGVRDAVGINWQRLLELADRHRVQALCWEGLGKLQNSAPAEIADQFVARSRAVVETNLRAAFECGRLLNIFRSAGVDLLFVKGLTLGALAYPNPMLKMGADIDLLVSTGQIPEAARLLSDAGYQLLVPADRHRLTRWHARRKESVWHPANGGFSIDLHSRLADHPAMLSDVGVHSPRQMVTVANDIELPTLAKGELFAYLCVHGASSAWFRLKWIADLAALLGRERPVEIARLYGRSQQLGAGRAADQALLLANRLFGLELTRELRLRFEDGWAGRWLASVGEAQLANTDEPTERFLGTAAIHYSQPFLLPGLGFKLSELARQLRDALPMQAS